MEEIWCLGSSGPGALVTCVVSTGCEVDSEVKPASSFLYNLCSFVGGEVT
jgi:hypothetical protein